jgi:hypothetical protein
MPRPEAKMLLGKLSASFEHLVGSGDQRSDKTSEQGNEVVPPQADPLGSETASYPLKLVFGKAPQTARRGVALG